MKEQYDKDLIYLAGWRPEYKGSVLEFIGDCVGFIINYVAESWRTPEQARKEVERRKKMLQEWIDSQPRDASEIRVLHAPQGLVDIAKMN